MNCPGSIVRLHPSGCNVVVGQPGPLRQPPHLHFHLHHLLPSQGTFQERYTCAWLELWLWRWGVHSRDALSAGGLGLQRTVGRSLSAKWRPRDKQGSVLKFERLYLCEANASILKIPENYTTGPFNGTSLRRKPPPQMLLGVHLPKKAVKTPS
jgi:hypothetical protein